MTFGPEEEIVVDYPQSTHQFPADGCRYCALVRFNTELDQLEEGPYHFMIFVDGRKVAENTIRVDKKFFTCAGTRSSVTRTSYAAFRTDSVST